MSKKPATFSKNIELAQSFVDKLEQEDLTLEQMLKYYNGGMDSIKICQEQLETAKQKIIDINNKLAN